MSPYSFDASWSEERTRLGAIELTWDRYTRRRIEELGLAQGWRCLEVGAGGGTITRWLADRVGSSGRVAATDLDTRFLDDIEAANVTVQRHDITADPLEDGSFDLVHARLLLEHLSAREDALKRMTAALKPGGVLLIEDYDWVSGFTGMPQSPAMVKVTTATLDLMTMNGYDRDYGRKLPGALADHGLEDVRGEGVVLVQDSSSPAQSFYRLTLEQLRVPLVGTGLLTDADIDDALRTMDDPEQRSLSPILMQASGRKPG